MSIEKRHIDHLIERLNQLTGHSPEWDAPGHFSLEGSRGNRRIAQNTTTGTKTIIQGGSCGVLMTEKEVYKALKLACEVLESLSNR
jgi:hypothetical protein